MLNKIDFNSIDMDKRTKIEIEEDIKSFDINLNIVDDIEIPDLNKISKKSIHRAREDKFEFDKLLIGNILVVFILGGSIVSLYNPALTYKIAPVYNFFKDINESLNIDFIANLLGINKVVPKVDINESGKLEVIEDPSLIKEEDVKIPKSSKEALNFIHSISNTIVEAKHKWESTEITPKTIEIALNSVELIEDDSIKIYLKSSLTKWSQGDFSNGVELHNCVWEKLDGSIGIAESLDEEMIDKIVKKYFSNKNE